MTTPEADYLVVGAGAMGMAFTDTLVTETDAQVVVVDRGPAPGGHWTRAYPFVRPHQPSAYYGVNSRPLGSDSIDQLGWNGGLYELATMAEHRNQIRWLEDGELMEWLCSARLDLMRHMYAPLIGKPRRTRDKVFGLIAAGLRSANDKLDRLLSEHLSALSHAADQCR